MYPANSNGSFLVRKSTSDPGKYAFSLRNSKGIIQHFKIRTLDNGRWYISSKDSFETVSELLAYYQEVGLNGVKLKVPCLVSDKPDTAGLSREANKTWEIDRKSIDFVTKLGTGQFSEVWKGLWNNTTEVAVKIHHTMSPSVLLEEAVRMKELKHPKLIRVYAICTKEEPVYIVTELMKHGSLRDYLRGDGHSLKLLQLLDMGTQVVTGMAYLEKNNYVHRGLAARNVLVGENLACKVADFGLAGCIGANIPVKWTAPEAALHNHFTIKSDVWSFGILLYELITYGRFPYPGMKNTQVIEALQANYRMSCPEGCPELLYKIMSDCWRGDAASRPTFETLQWRLEDFFHTDTGPVHRAIHL